MKGRGREGLVGQFCGHLVVVLPVAASLMAEVVDDKEGRRRLGSSVMVGNKWVRSVSRRGRKGTVKCPGKVRARVIL